MGRKKWGSRGSWGWELRYATPHTLHHGLFFHTCIKEDPESWAGETLFYLGLEGSEACWKRICRYTPIDSCWFCRSGAGMGEGGGTWLRTQVENEKMKQASAPQRGPVWEDQVCWGMSGYSPVWNREVANPAVSIRGQRSEQSGSDTICQAR